MSNNKRKLSLKQYSIAIFGVATLSFKTAPLAISFKLIGIIVNAALPIITTFFAALTTTELANAYNGVPDAGEKVLLYVLITAALGLFSSVWSSFDGYIQQLMRYQVEAKVGDTMYEHFVSLEFWRYDDKDTADLYDRAQKFSSVYAYVFDRIATIVTQLVTLTFSIIALALFTPWIAVIVLVAVLPSVYVQFTLSRLQVNHWNKNVDVRRAKSFISWNLLQPIAIAELRLNNLAKHFIQLHASLRQKDEKARINYERKYIGKRILADGIQTVAETISLVWITLQIIDRAQPIGQFIYVQQMVSRALSSSNSFVSEISAIDEDLANLFDYQEFMKLPIRHGGERALETAPELISLESVSFAYPQTKQHVLEDVSLSIKAGQHVAIVGENGAGKSTLVKLITGLYTPSKGIVALDGTDLRDYDIASWHSKLAVLQQDFQHYSFTSIAQNISFGDVSRKPRDTHIRESLQQAEALEFVQKLPKGLDTLSSPWMETDEGEKGVDLSGGQWQRIALARGFYRNAPIIILDEPTSAIDALAEARIFKRLFSRQNNKTVITISHRLSTIEKADIIYMFEHGSIVESGTYAELVALRGAFYRMFESQLQK